MAMEDWGLTDKGYKTPNQAEIREVLDQKTREGFGDDVNLSDKSPNGIFNGILSEFFGDFWQLSEATYNAQHPSTAEGVQLDYQAIFYGTSRIAGEYAYTNLLFQGTAGHTEANGKQYQTESGIFFTLSEDVTFDTNGIGYGLVYANETGAQGNVSANTITIQVEPDSDVVSVTNPEAAFGGVNRESDEELRNRLENSESSLGSGTVNAIFSQLQSVPGVRAVRVKVNVQDITVDGQPPHSIMVYALGGEGEDIAEVLMNNFTGNQFFGSETYVVKDVGGFDHEISFSRPTTINVASSVDVTTNSNFNSRGVDEIKNAIISIVGGVDTNNASHNGLNMGEDVIYAQLLGAIMRVDGIVDVSLRIGKVGETLTNSNITIEDGEVANANINDIVVQVN